MIISSEVIIGLLSRKLGTKFGKSSSEPSSTIKPKKYYDTNILADSGLVRKADLSSLKISKTFLDTDLTLLKQRKKDWGLA